MLQDHADGRLHRWHASLPPALPDATTDTLYIRQLSDGHAFPAMLANLLLILLKRQGLPSSGHTVKYCPRAASPPLEPSTVHTQNVSGWLPGSACSHSNIAGAQRLCL